ncbi:hypothetical protein C7E17_26150, partial [Stenotrophomonas maltophilia]
MPLGATPLKPEKATNYSLGLTWDPSPAFHLAVDCLPDRHPLRRRRLPLGATPLKPEKATNYSLGLTWDPSPA